MAFNASQPRDSRGRWTDGAGVARRSRSIEEISEQIQPRRRQMTRERLREIRRETRSIIEGTAPRHRLEFASPRARAEAIARTGSPRMTTTQALARELPMLRGTRIRSRVDIVRNPSTGRFRAVAPLERDVPQRTRTGELVAEAVRPRRRRSAR